MTQPPDPTNQPTDEPASRPLEPDAPSTSLPDDQPTVAWTPTTPAGTLADPAAPGPVPEHRRLMTTSPVPIPPPPPPPPPPALTLIELAPGLRA